MEVEPLRPLLENQKVDKVKKNNDPNSKVSVEKIYQKKTQLEHILLRPDTYIGSVEPVTQQMWVFDEEDGLNCRDVTFVPGLYKIFDEILVNAADNKQRDKSMSCIKVTIDAENNTISVWNNGKGIPVVEHKVEKVYVPALIFGQLLTSSNYDDDQKKVTGGRNGYGAKLCNIFSSRFTVETACKEYRKLFKQTWTNNMSKAGEYKLKSFDGDDYTCITFQPDLSKFKMQSLDKDIIALMSRRAYDVAGSSQGVKVFLNGKKLPVSGFRSYVDLYVKDKVDETGNPLKIIHEVVNHRWDVCLTMSEKGFQQISFVNSIATTKGGRHVDYVADQIVNKLIDVVKKKNKGGITVKPFQVKNHIWLFVNSLIENPTFDSQTKENMTLQAKSFGSTCPLSEKFIKAAIGCGIVESILNWVKFKAQNQLNKKCSAVKHTKIKGIPKLDDANDAGSRNSQDCTLILTEGDSAKTLAVSGLGVIGRDRFGVFPLRGKMLNVREASHKQIMENMEINNIIKIVGLQYKKTYDDNESLRSLRYGRIMIMTDQDQDGSHIKGLLINFIHHNWPSLLRHSFLEEFITPIIKVSKSKQELAFYSIPEFEEWKNSTDNHKTWRIKYYKGLGTSTSKEAKEYFADMKRHRIPFMYSGPADDAAICLAFSKKKVDDRKEWLTHFMEDRRQRRLHGLPEEYLYGKATKNLTFNDFINKELILFSNSDNERSIPSLADGMKPGQRKVLYTCFRRADKREVKVAQLAGSVAEMSAYHHGEQSLMMTIINLAQSFVGSNNINLLQPIGQFGTRLHGGKDAASPRYIFTMLSPLARLLYPPMDDNVLKFLYDDNQRVEPEWYLPIIPLVLVNGAEGIGTGWACKIPNYDPREIVNNVRRMLEGEEPLPMLPSYKNFKGMIQDLGPNQYLISGEVSVLDTTTIEISELPVRTWTQVYKEQVLEPMLNGNEKTPPLITDYKEYHTDTTIRFLVTMTEQKLAEAEAVGLHKVFKLQTSLTCNSMVLFDHMGCLKKYESVQDILKEFFDLRLRYYSLRKDWLVGMLTAESTKLNNQARFILEKIEGKIIIENKPKKELIQVLIQRGYDSDPVKAWKETQEKEHEGGMTEEEEEEESIATSGPDFNYLLGMPLWYLTKEKKDELCKQRDSKEEQLLDIKKKCPSDLWKEDLAAFVEQLEQVEAREREDELIGMAGKPIKGKVGKPKVKKLQLAETMPSPHGRRVVPRITTAMKAEATKKIKRRIKGEDPIAVKMEFGEEVEGCSPEQNSPETQNLTERLSKKAGSDAGTKRAKGKKQATLPFKPMKKEKHNPWSGSDSESEDSDDPDMVQVISREPVPRRAAAKANAVYVLDSAEEDSDKDQKPYRKELSEDEFTPKPADIFEPAISAVKPKAEPKKKEKKQTSKVSGVEAMPAVTTSSSIEIPDNDSENRVTVELTSASAVPSEKPAPKKRALGKKTTTSAANKQDKQQPSILEALTKTKAAAKPSKSSKAKAPKAVSRDSDAEMLTPEKAAPAKMKRVRKRKTSDSEDSDSDFGVKKSTAIKKSKKADESFHVTLDPDSDSELAIAPREQSRRVMKRIQYLEESDDELF
ncbi:DNA topoisomerase 2-alpha [Rhinatrema bivittatum]|uniref:DNA topoisomerase 2-alpha n=1 Tax=Rhinatrema bivittatum TaxID=194408 RepID=UPI00112CDF99|nr:DNA topoisomerase 2-alpha [Rhinatrema bivittatum]